MLTGTSYPRLESTRSLTYNQTRAWLHGRVKRNGMSRSGPSHKVRPSLRSLTIERGPHGGRNKTKIKLACNQALRVYFWAGIPAASRTLPCSLHQYVLNDRTSLTHKSPVRGASQPSPKQATLNFSHQDKDSLPLIFTFSRSLPPF